MIKNNIGIIAEIANAHQGKVEEAISLYESAKSAGAKAIKFQIYTAEELLVRSHERFEHFKKQSFSVDEWDHIFNTVDRQGVEVYSDVFGPKSFDYATTLSLDGIKIHSSDLGNHEMLSRIREFRGKVFISAGGSTAPELVNFVNPIIEADNAKEIILMHGFQTYPTPVNDSNLNKFNFFEELFGDRISYGYMDHLDAESELSYYIPYSLLFSGISYIEKHITHNRHLKGIDYFSSFEPQEFFTFLNVIQEIQSSFGRKDPFFSDSEITYRKQAKKVYVWSNDLKAGHVITESDVVMKRLDTEISSLSYGDLIGKKLIQNVSKEAQALKISLNSSVLAVIVVEQIHQDSQERP